MADKSLDLIIHAWRDAGGPNEKGERIDSSGKPAEWSKHGVPCERGWEVCWHEDEEDEPPELVAYSYIAGIWVIPEEYKIVECEEKLPDRPPHQSKNKVKPH